MHNVKQSVFLNMQVDICVPEMAVIQMEAEWGTCSAQLREVLGTFTGPRV